jgi:hypothetical protein
MNKFISHSMSITMHLRAPVTYVWLMIAFYSMLSMACDSNQFTETKSNGIAVEPANVIFESLSTNLPFSRQVVEVSQTGEASLTISAIYLQVSGENQENCDRVTAGIDPTKILESTDLPGCQFLIGDRPELPFTLNNNEFKQVDLTFRSLGNDGEMISEATLVIESDAADDRVIEVPLEIELGQPELIGQPAVLGFETQIDTPDTVNYILRNIGSAPAVINSIFIDEGEKETLEFDWDATQTVPSTLEASKNNNNMTVRVTYTPVDTGVDEATLVIQATDLSGIPIPEIRVKLTSEQLPSNLEITPKPVVFEHVPGVTKEAGVVFNNLGLSDISILGIEFTDPNMQFKLQDANQNSFFLQAGGTKDVVLTYRAGSEPTTSTMRVLTDAENAVREAGQTNGYLTIPLTTNQSVGIKDLSADPATLDFNAVAVGDSMEKTLTLSSTGTDAVTIDQLTLLGTGDGHFSVTSVEQNNLAPTESTTVTVTFTRPEEPAPSTYIEQLTITSDSSAGDVIVNLVANP